MDPSTKSLYQKLGLEMRASALIILGAVFLGVVGITNINPVNYSRSPMIAIITRFIYIVIGVAGLYFAFKRDFYLPFLGRTVFPCEPLAEKAPVNADTAITIQTLPNANVIYWAAEPAPSTVVDNPWLAYKKNENSGVARADPSGVATLRVRTPTAYKIPNGTPLRPHIHYRTCLSNGILDRVETVFL
jgi:uncharacterized membrane protein YuzA (DUF378 family)